MLAVEDNEEEQQKKLLKFGTTESVTVRRDHDGPLRGSSTQPRFGRFPAIRILVELGFCFFINSLKNLIFEVRLRIVRLYEIRHQIFRLCVGF